MASMRNLLHRLRVRWRDEMHYSRFSRELLGHLHDFRARLTRDPVRRIESSIQAYRFSSKPKVKSRAIRVFRAWADDRIWWEKEIGWSRYAQQLLAPSLTRSVILKAPDAEGEKGVILITFEYNWLRFLRGVDDLAELEREYDIVFSTSSSPSNYAMLGLALSRLNGPVYVQACNYGEIADIENLHPRLKCLPMLPCDWIDPRFSLPRPRADRDVDILMVAGWAPVKRQWQFYDALSRMPAELRIVMIGQAEGRFDIEHARHEARLFGARQAIEFHQSLPIDQVADYQGRAKVSIILSRREGCCVAVTESFFADTPVGLLADAHIGPLAYINDRTGVRLDRDQDLAPQLMGFLARWDSFAAKEWAEEHVSCDVSSQKLNGFLRAAALEEGRKWSRNIVIPCWRPHPTVRYQPEASAVVASYGDLHARYPDLFGADLMDQSYR
jgi:glycosyltransferase involved in cell wall biosynthesis